MVNLWWSTKNGHLLLVMMMFYSQKLEDFGSQLPIQGWG